MDSESALNISIEQRVTLKDVARAADVSAATVSRFINTPVAVRTDKRQRIEDAIKTLGYVPHGAAQALASRRSRMIGAIFPSIDNTLFGCALEVFQHHASAADYTVVVASSEYDPELETRQVRRLLRSGVDALLLVGVERSPEVYNLITARKIPYVTLWRSGGDILHPCVGFDNVAATEHLTDYLIGLGHKRFGVFSGLLKHNDRAQDRVSGVYKSLENHGISAENATILERQFGVDEGREMFRQITSNRNPPTAIICGSEPFAYGAIFEAAEMGIDVPGEISIAGFDDLWLSSQIKPSLTTIRTPQREMAERAARYLLARLSGEQVAAPRPLEIDLIIRNSTGTAPTDL